MPKKKAARKSAVKSAVAGKSRQAEKSSYKLGVGDKAPKFSAPATSGSVLGSKELAGRALVLYFYPKDNTPGCTLEGQDFRRLAGAFRKLGAEIVGVSRDSLKSHDGFKLKCDFPFELLADEDGKVCAAFDVVQMKSLYGRKFMGIERSTFVIGPDGKIAAEWRKVRVAGHADEVLSVVKGLIAK
jgi:peroxiredoxin Q/BCP